MRALRRAFSTFAASMSMATTWRQRRARAMALPPQPQKASTTTSVGRHRAAMARAIFSGVTEYQLSASNWMPQS